MHDDPWWIMIHDAWWCMIIDDSQWFMIITDAWLMIMNDAWSSMMHHDTRFMGVSLDDLGGWGQKIYRQNHARHVGGKNWHETGPRESPEYIDYLKMHSFSMRSRSWRREVAKTMILHRNGRFSGRHFRSIFGNFFGVPLTNKKKPCCFLSPSSVWVFCPRWLSPRGLKIARHGTSIFFLNRQTIGDSWPCNGFF